MLTNAMVTIVKGSTIEFLNIPEKEYLSKYKSISNECAQKCIQDYFDGKNIDINSKVIDVKLEPEIHNVKITLDRKKGE
ncbi:hypothetical protein SH2C18_43750 [Clostridium sediminicola]|uniref:hypothetical protein n=1 Tax=Clostridium sediminicola TaxID=3114879 RepID=UPI0031F27E00